MITRSHVASTSDRMCVESSTVLFGCQAADQAPHLDDLRRVQAHGRLVQDQQLGPVQDGLGQTDALAIALAELADGAGQVLLQARSADRV